MSAYGGMERGRMPPPARVVATGRRDFIPTTAIVHGKCRSPTRSSFTSMPRIYSAPRLSALNLFLLLREGARKALSERVSRTVETRLLVEEVRFERVTPGALLEELEGNRPGEDEPATTVDVVLWSRPGG